MWEILERRLVTEATPTDVGWKSLRRFPYTGPTVTQ